MKKTVISFCIRFGDSLCKEGLTRNIEKVAKEMKDGEPFAHDRLLCLYIHIFSIYLFVFIHLCILGNN